MIITVFRGFIISAHALDAFFAANGVRQIYGIRHGPRDDEGVDEFADLFYEKVIKAGGAADRRRYQLVVPALLNYYESRIAYVTYDRVSINYQSGEKLDIELPEEVPIGFEQLRTDILSYCAAAGPYKEIRDEGSLGLFMINADALTGAEMPPQAFGGANDAIRQCDACNELFGNPGAMEKRLQHRWEVHNLKEDDQVCYDGESDEDQSPEARRERQQKKRPMLWAAMMRGSQILKQMEDEGKITPFIVKYPTIVEANSQEPYDSKQSGTAEIHNL